MNSRGCGKKGRFYKAPEEHFAMMVPRYYSTMENLKISSFRMKTGS